MYDLIIIGAGPSGIALAAEACASGIKQSQILVMEKRATHNSAIRQLYFDWAFHVSTRPPRITNLMAMTLPSIPDITFLLVQLLQSGRSLRRTNETLNTQVFVKSARAFTKWNSG